MKTEFHVIAVLVIIVSFIVLRSLYTRALRSLGTVRLSWYTEQAVLGLVILLAYMITALVMIISTGDEIYVPLIYIGILFTVYYVIYGKAAAGSTGVLVAGMPIRWEQISGSETSEGMFGTLQWRFHWRKDAGDNHGKKGRLTIPSKHRETMKEIINTSVTESQAAV